MIEASIIVKYTNIFPNTNIELTNSAVAIFAKSAKISPAEFALMWSLCIKRIIKDMRDNNSVISYSEIHEVNPNDFIKLLNT